MSVSDPLIRDIKGHGLKLIEEARTCGHIDDSSPNLVGFCQGLEVIFTRGLIPQRTLLQQLTRRPPGPYEWMEGVTRGSDNFAYQSCVDLVKCDHNVQGPVGRFRLLVRYCLVKKCLHWPVECLATERMCRKFYEGHSVIGDEILVSIFLSVLRQFGKIKFTLDLSNSSFLDETWMLPEVLRLELVPCKSLGMAVSFSNNKAIIVDIQRNSVLSEYSKICKGDVLDNLNGVPISSSSKGRLGAIFHLSKGRPTKVVLLKAFHKGLDGIFPPIKEMLRSLQIEISEDAPNQSTTNSGDAKIRKNLSEKNAATYYGYVELGSKGSAAQIDRAVRYLLGSPEGTATDKKNLSRRVTFEIGEINIRVLSIETREVVLKHSYMQISACGTPPRRPNYIAYIAGDDNCDVPTKFTCHIFRVDSTDHASSVLQCIDQGFQRTHFVA